MKTLTLLRHAKSGWDDPVERDFDRPLNPKGVRAAVTMGRRAAELGLTADRMVASPAARVKATLESFSQGLGRALEPVWDRRVYLASAATLLDIIHETDASVDHLMIVGHNPGLEDLVLMLVPDDGSSPLRTEVEAKFPTATIARMRWSGNDWKALGPDGNVILDLFIRPRDVDPMLGPDT